MVPNYNPKSWGSEFRSKSHSRRDAALVLVRVAKLSVPVEELAVAKPTSLESFQGGQIYSLAVPPTRQLWG